jgi:hypothetical protein
MATFKVTVDGKSYITEDLTLGEVEQIEDKTGMSWYAIDFRTAAQCVAIMAAFLARDMGQEAAEAKVRAITVKAALDSVERVTESLPDTYQDGVPNPVGEATTT